MNFLHSVLAFQISMEQLPMAAAIGCGLLLVLAFVLGWDYGFRRIGWGALVWLFSGAAFLLLNHYFNESNPIRSIPFIMDQSPEIQAFASSFSIAIACILVALIINGIFAAIYRPHKKVVEEPDPVEIRYGFEFESDPELYEDSGPRVNVVLVGGGEPTVWGRILGALFFTVSTVVAMAVILSLGLLVVSTTSLKDYVGNLLELDIVKLIKDYALLYLLDFLTIGLIIVIAKKGYKNGLIGSIRSLVVVVGGIGAAVLAFWLPFSQFATWGPISVLISSCVKVVGTEAMFADVAAKLLAGLCMFIVAVVILLLVNVILVNVNDTIRGNRPTRVIDGILACVFYLVVGIAVVAGIWALLYVLETCGLFNASVLFSDKSSLSQGFYEACETFLKPWLDKLMSGVLGA